MIRASQVAIYLRGSFRKFSRGGKSCWLKSLGKGGGRFWKRGINAPPPPCPPTWIPAIYLFIYLLICLSIIFLPIYLFIYTCTVSMYICSDMPRMQQRGQAAPLWWVRPRVSEICIIVVVRGKKLTHFIYPCSQSSTAAIVVSSSLVPRPHFLYPLEKRVWSTAYSIFVQCARMLEHCSF